MAEADESVTSERVAVMMGINPVVVRRTMAGLRNLALVTTGKGHDGGWTIVCDFDQVTQYDIYVALGSPKIFAMGSSERETGVPRRAGDQCCFAAAFQDAEALLLLQLSDITLGRLEAVMNFLLVSRPV